MKQHFLKLTVAFIFTTQTAFATSVVDDYKMYFKQAQQMNSFVAWKYMKEKYSRQDQVLIEAWLLSSTDETQPKFDIKDYFSSADEKPMRLTAQLGTQKTTLELKIASDGGDTKNAANNRVFWGDQKSVLAEQLQAMGLPLDRVVKLSETRNHISAPQLAALSDQEYFVFLMQKRALLESAQKVLLKSSLTKKDKKTSSYMLWSLLFPTAVAGNERACLDQLGFISTLDGSGKCALKTDLSQHPLFSQLSCSSGSVCNPEMYGLNRDGSGKALCLQASDVESGKTCSSLSPLNSADDVQKMFASMQGLMKGRMQKMGGQPPAGRPEDRLISEALKICESDATQKSTTACQELFQRKTFMNSTVARAEGTTAADRKASGGPERRQSLSATERDDAMPRTRASKSDDCGIFCTVGNWLTSDIGVKSMIAFGSAFVGYYLAKRKYKSSGTTTTASTTTTSTTGTTDVYGLPAMPTTPDYSGAAQ